MKRQIRIALIAITVGIMLVTLPLVSNNYILRLVTTMMMYGVLALGWNFIGGFAGYPSFASAAFFGLGAYAGAISQIHGVPITFAWMIGTATAGLFAGGLGLALLRLKGHYFAIATFVVVEVMREISNSLTDITGGGMGLNLPILGVNVTTETRIFYYAMLAMITAAILITFLASQHRLVFALKCVKQNESAASMTGINTTLFKTTGFILSGLLAGCAGAFYASWVNYIEPGDVFDIMLSIKPIIMVLLGGAGTIIGPVVGATIFLFLEEVVWRNFLNFHVGILGLFTVAIVVFLPNGVLTLHMRKINFLRK